MLLAYVVASALSGGHLVTNRLGVGVVLTWSLMLGGHLAIGALTVRSTFVVPITVRERWLVVMGFVSVVMPLCLTLGTTVGLALPWANPAVFVFEPLLVATLLTWGYTSVGLLWLLVFDAATRRRLIPEVDLVGRKIRPRFDGGLLRLLIVIAVGAAAVWLPLKLRDFLPLRFSDFTAVKGAVAALVGLGALFAWRFTPVDHVPSPPRSPQTLEPITDPQVRRIRRLDQLSGPARLLVPQALLVGAGTIAVLTLNGLAAQFFGSFFGDLDNLASYFGVAVVGLAFAAPFNSMRRLLRVMPVPIGARVWFPIAGQALNTLAVVLGVQLFRTFADTLWPANAVLEFTAMLFGLAALGAALASRFEFQPGHDGREIAGPLAMGLAMGSANIVADIWKRVVPESVEGLVAVAVGVVALLIAVLLLSRPTVRRRPSASSRPPSSSRPSSQPAASS
jgi:hypothetical protein